jgi:ABC-type glycerol-3-phosphate transport system permease component
VDPGDASSAHHHRHSLLRDHQNLGLSDTHFALVITYVSYGLPFVIWLMLGFSQDMPADIERAAIVDGCSGGSASARWCCHDLTRLAVTAIFAFIYAWNRFL